MIGPNTAALYERKAAKEAIMAQSGADEATARNIVLAIVAGTIPNVSMRF